MESDLHEDKRGVFRRSFCRRELDQLGVKFEVKQGNISENLKKHTLRGFHYQVEPRAESKVLTCIVGRTYNIVVDLRPKSAFYQHWVPVEISAEDRRSILIPPGCANAFLTMSDNTILHYYMGEFFEPSCYRGIRYNDPLFRFEWPREPAEISERDLGFPNYRDICDGLD